jgi:hypothetical protein
MAYIELFANLQEVGLGCHYPEQVVISDEVFRLEDVRPPGYRSDPAYPDNLGLGCLR